MKNERLNDVIIALSVSQNKVRPKIFGLFKSGQIQQYYSHRQFRIEEQNDPNLVNELSRKLARVHAMDVPIKKTGNWVFETFDSFYEIAYQKFPINQLIEECNCETLKKHDLKKEIQWLKNCVKETNSPIVFCHNDFRGSNIMVTDPNNNNIGDKKDRITLCDFEYSSYGYRGYDFGCIFSE
jgi:choline/ethanolamine kinase